MLFAVLFSVQISAQILMSTTGSYQQNFHTLIPTKLRKVSYFGVQWRNSSAAAQIVAFYYKISSSIITDLQPYVNLGWPAVANLDFISPVTRVTVGALEGNALSNKVTKSNISILASSYILLKWDDPDHPDIDQRLAIDDVSINWTVNDVPSPSIF